MDKVFLGVCTKHRTNVAQQVATEFFAFLHKTRAAFCGFKVCVANFHNSMRVRTRAENTFENLKCVFTRRTK